MIVFCIASHLKNILIRPVHRLAVLGARAAECAQTYQKLGDALLVLGREVSVTTCTHARAHIYIYTVKWANISMDAAI